MTSLKAEVNYGDAYQSYGRLCGMLEVTFYYIKKSDKAGREESVQGNVK